MCETIKCKFEITDEIQMRCNNMYVKFMKFNICKWKMYILYQINENVNTEMQGKVYAINIQHDICTVAKICGLE